MIDTMYVAQVKIGVHSGSPVDLIVHTYSNIPVILCTRPIYHKAFAKKILSDLMTGDWQ